MSSENTQYSIPPLTSFNQSLNIGSSKSHSNRALILGAILGNHFTIKNISQSTDVINLIKVFKKIGLQLIEKEREIIFLNSFPECESEIEGNDIQLETGDGGTTNRFLLPLLARGKKKYQLIPTERMKERPMMDLINPLRELGVSVEQGESFWLSVKGPINLEKKITLEIDSSKSSQFASALKLAYFDLTLISINPLNLNSSKTYLDLTDHMIKSVLTNESNSYFVPIDYSSISYPASLAVVLKGQVIIKNAKERDFFQADSHFLDLLDKIGANVNFHNGELIISCNEKLKNFQFNCSIAPDLFPTLVFLASHIEGESQLLHLNVLEFKESNRVVEMIKLLDAFKVKYQFDSISQSLSIFGNKLPIMIDCASIETARDHRIVMAASLFLSCNRGGLIKNFDCIKKSYSHFDELFK